MSSAEIARRAHGAPTVQPMRALLIANAVDADSGLRRRAGCAATATPSPSATASARRSGPTLDGHDLVLLLGSEWSVYWPDVAASVAAEAALISEAQHRGVPQFGICFGSQVDGARARRDGRAGARRPRSAGTTSSPTSPASIAPGPWLQWHADVVTVPPRRGGDGAQRRRAAGVAARSQLLHPVPPRGDGVDARAVVRGRRRGGAGEGRQLRRADDGGDPSQRRGQPRALRPARRLVPRARRRRRCHPRSADVGPFWARIVPASGNERAQKPRVGRIAPRNPVRSRRPSTGWRACSSQPSNAGPAARRSQRVEPLLGVAGEVGLDRPERLLDHAPHALAEQAHDLHQLQPGDRGALGACRSTAGAASRRSASGNSPLTLRLPRSKNGSFIPAYSKSSSHARPWANSTFISVRSLWQGTGGDGRRLERPLDPPADLVQPLVARRRDDALGGGVPRMPLHDPVDGERLGERAARVEAADHVDDVRQAVDERAVVEVPAAEVRGDQGARGGELAEHRRPDAQRGGPRRRLCPVRLRHAEQRGARPRHPDDVLLVPLLGRRLGVPGTGERPAGLPPPTVTTKLRVAMSASSDRSWSGADRHAGTERTIRSTSRRSNCITPGPLA